MSLTIALVPAKSNSRRLPGKNVRLLAGFPLFIHSIRVARACSQIDHVVVSSDSDEILIQAEEAGVITIKRPIELCGDSVPNFEVCRHVVEELAKTGMEVEQIVLLQPTHPFRDAAGIEDAIQRFSDRPDDDSLISVAEVHRVMGAMNEDGVWHGRSSAQGVSAQNAEQLFEITGHLFILRVGRTLEHGSLLGEQIYSWMLPQNWLDIDIDTPDDFMVAECVANRFFSQMPA